MQLANFKRLRVLIPLVFVTVLIVVSVVVFHPSFQRKMLLDYVVPHVSALSFDLVHITPWSMDIENLAIEYEGGHFQIGKGAIRYCGLVIKGKQKSTANNFDYSDKYKNVIKTTI